MKPEGIHKYYYFGTCQRFLQDAEATMSIYGSGCIIENIDSLLDTMNELELSVTKRCRPIYNLISLREELQKNEDATELGEENALKLKRIMSELRTTLDAEITGLEAYTVTPKRIDVKKLLQDVPSLFAPNVFALLPDIAKYDLFEAGKCIAFERPTAAAFHLLRATESVLRQLYCHLVKRKRVDPQLWGTMVADLRGRAKTRKHTTLYNNLDNIRLSFRNPTQHPDKIYDIQEVQDLWPLCVEAINRMVKIYHSN
jgi:hypothetical protein